METMSVEQAMKKRRRKPLSEALREIAEAAGTFDFEAFYDATGRTMPGREYRLVVPNWTPPRLNQAIGCHWRKLNRLKCETIGLLTVYAREQSVPAATCRRSVRLIVTLGPGQKTPDEDAYDKMLLDALTRAGLLIDDGKRGLKGRMAVEFKRGPQKQTEIVLTESP